MENALAAIKQTIPEFAGYDEEVARRRSDEQIRAFAGEALALLHDRHADYFDDDASRRYDDLILRCEFMNQEAFKNFEYAQLDDGRKLEIAQGDHALLELASRSADVTAQTVGKYIQEFSEAFDRRDGLITST